MSKNKKQALAILIAIFVVFSVCVFAAPFHKNGVFWLSYIFEVIALALQIPVFKLAFDNREELKSKVLGFPVFRIGYIYLAVQTVCSLLFMIISSNADMPAWVAVIIYTVIAGGAFVCSMAADIARDEVERVEFATKKDTSAMTELRVVSASLEAMAKDAGSKKAAKKLAEDIRFSDPVSSPATEEDERLLSAKLEEIEAAISGGGDIPALCAQAERILGVRNTKCKANK